ncbi:hypothetical protein BWI17_14890 [Betaproteobacteria bacterium GR16-43]|nr:hypothetical protein BWI17_14890 [Betaproteobacteria bacterium GR16-43]
MMTFRPFLAAALFALALPAAAQAVPNANYSDMWWNANESGWGLSIMQHANNKVFVVMYTYDPRLPDTTTADGSDFKPLWIFLSDSTWVTPTQFTGRVYVADGIPFFQTGSNTTINDVGTFTFTFSDFSNATFQYNIAPQGGLAANAPAFGLPAFNGVKAITRQPY